MVDCGNARCAQERRLFKKELMTWSKKVPLLVGLETIAECLGGEALSRDLFEPWRSLETDETVDWEPDEDCFYCDKKLKFLFESVNELEEEDVGNTTQEGLGLGYLNELLPYCPQYYTSSPTHADVNQPLDLSAAGSRSPSRSTDGEAATPSSAGRSHVELKIPQVKSQSSKYRKDGLLNGKRSYTEDELAAAVNDIRSGKLGTRRAAALYGIPRSTLRNKIFKLESDQGPRETDDDESTDEPTSTPVQLSVPPLPTALDNKMTLTELMQSNPFILMPPLPFPMHMAHMETALNNNNNVHCHDDAWQWRLEQIRRKHNLNGLKEEDDFRAMCGLDPVDVEDSREREEQSASSPAPTSGDLKMTLLPELVRRLTEQRMDMERHVGLIPPPAHCHTHRSPAEESKVDPVLSMPSPQLASSACLRIPSYKPTRTASSEESPPSDSRELKAYDCGKIGDTLKDVIAKTIAEKVRNRTQYGGLPESEPYIPHAAPRSSSPEPEGASAFSIPSASATKKPRRQYHHRNQRDQKNNHADPSNIASTTTTTVGGKENNTTATASSTRNEPAAANNSAAAPVKKTRPKRGQYRKYNSQLLMEAVKAVQRGEMSVHRAGSYFGVPHSTLEYKVKERHLLRQKKVKESQAAKQSAAAAAAASTASTSTNGDSSSKEDKQPSSSSNDKTSSTARSSKSKQSKTSEMNGMFKFDHARPLSSWLHPPGNGLVFNTPTGMPPSPFAANFALSTPASELLRKLQQKVQNKSQPFAPDEFLPNGFPRSNGAGALQDGFLFIK